MLSYVFFQLQDIPDQSLIRSYFQRNVPIHTKHFHFLLLYYARNKQHPEWILQVLLKRTDTHRPALQTGHSQDFCDICSCRLSHWKQKDWLLLSLQPDSVQYFMDPAPTNLHKALDATLNDGISLHSNRIFLLICTARPPILITVSNSLPE